MVYTIDNLLSKILNSENNIYDIKKIIAAYETAAAAHAGQKRDSGEPYISHPLAVAAALVELNIDTDTVVAALLHDVIEDSNIELSSLKKKFGSDVAFLVDGVTKLDKVPLVDKEEEEAKNIRKILLTMAKDPRVILIKLADRLHNMNTLQSRPLQKQLATSLETINYYAPLAHRLGMNHMKEQMEDLAFSYLDSFAYSSIREELASRKKELDIAIERIKKNITENLNFIKPAPIVEGRVKGMYSIYKKTYVANKEFKEIFDIFGVRIIVETQNDCYTVLGVIHNLYTPIPGRFKDYIGVPKPNQYQSLHTTVIAKQGKTTFEVQIRTKEMHQTAEYGIAAHWRYKEGQKNKFKAPVIDKLKWIHDVLSQQQEAGNVEYLTEAIKTDLNPEDVYVFTPRGDTITLPKGSTVIDFAYSIHTNVGNKMTGAEVSGRKVELNYQLATGDCIEIITTKDSKYGPDRNWIEIARTHNAKIKIQAWFRKERRPENISYGKFMFEKELKRNNITFDENNIKKITKAYRLKLIDDFYAHIGYGGITPIQAIQKLEKIIKEENVNIINEDSVIENTEKKQLRGVIVEGFENCPRKFAQCCSPIPEDEIIGFITRGYGISIHKRSCFNVNGKNPERLVNVSWDYNEYMLYNAAIEVISEDRVALFADLLNVIAEKNYSINSVFSNKLKNGNLCINMTVEVTSLSQLNEMIEKLNKVPGVLQVIRKEEFNNKLT